VHSQVCIVDDVWMAAGSDNLNRRSWTHDSEISCALLDGRRDPREPVDPSETGDGARVLPRDTRLRLACEHAGLTAADAETMVDPKAWFDCLRLAADELDSWYEHGKRGPRPTSHLRVHPRDPVARRGQSILRWMHASVLDPDGRPAPLRKRNEF
jgi:phosphatidylserine/phosphatidylglycerophosphate/cardiolipin synthase-like enzyme